MKRPYEVQPGKLKLKDEYKGPKGIYYSVGQPMGALSSWAMLAMTHHALMQFAAAKAFQRFIGPGESLG